MNRRRTGKIARLPRELREVANLMLRDGATYAQVIEKLADHGHGDINEQNLSNWREGGYQDWLKEQERLEDMRLKREFALQLVQENQGSKIHEASLQIAAGQIYEVLTDFNPAQLRELLSKEPENYARLVNSLARLSKGGLEYEKYRAEVEARKAEILQAVEKAKSGGITPETLAEMEEKVRLLP